MTKTRRRRAATHPKPLPSVDELQQLLTWVTKRTMEYIHTRNTNPALLEPGAAPGCRDDAEALQEMIQVMKDVDQNGRLLQFKGTTLTRIQRRVLAAGVLLETQMREERQSAGKSKARRMPTPQQAFQRLNAFHRAEIELNPEEQAELDGYRYDPEKTPVDNARSIISKVFRGRREGYSSETQKRWKTAIAGLIGQINRGAELIDIILTVDLRNGAFGCLTIPTAYMASFLGRFVCGANEHLMARWMTLLAENLDQRIAAGADSPGAQRPDPAQMPFLGNGTLVSWANMETPNPDGEGYWGRVLKPEENAEDRLLVALNDRPEPPAARCVYDVLITDLPPCPQPIDRA